MNNSNMPRRAARVLTVAVLAAWAATAGAQSSPPWYVAPQLSVTKDSNVFRANTGEVTDTISSVGLLGGVNIPFGRQAFLADVLVRRDEFRDQNQLDNTAYAPRRASRLGNDRAAVGELRRLLAPGTGAQRRARDVW